LASAEVTEEKHIPRCGILPSTTNFLINPSDNMTMIRVVAIALVAMAAFDLAFLNGQLVQAVEAITTDLLHQFVG
jgi:hypothetical protein